MVLLYSFVLDSLGPDMCCMFVAQLLSYFLVPYMISFEQGFNEYFLFGILRGVIIIILGNNFICT